MQAGRVREGVQSVQRSSGPAVQRSSGPAVQRSSGPAVQRSRAEARSAGGACFRRRLLALLLLGVPGLFTGVPGLVVAAPPLLLGALSLLAAPAAAEVLVSNFGKATHATAYSIQFVNNAQVMRGWGGISRRIISQRFSTGLHLSGYSLSNIELGAFVASGQTLTTQEVAEVRAELWTVGANRAKVADLTVPQSDLLNARERTSTSISPSTIVLAAPTNTILKPLTEYRLVLYTTPNDDPVHLLWAVTSDGSEDSGAGANWGIYERAETSVTQQPTVSTAYSGFLETSSTDVRILKIRVKGSKAPITSTHSGGLWSATLTTSSNSFSDGCSSEAECATALTNSNIQFSGSFSNLGANALTVTSLRVHDGGSLPNDLQIWLKDTGDISASFVEYAVLRIGSGASARDFAFKDATRTPQSNLTLFKWSKGDLVWAANQEVAVSIVIPETQQLSVYEATPACDSVVAGADLTRTHTYRLRLTPAPGAEQAVQFVPVDANGNILGGNGWLLEGHPIGSSGLNRELIEFNGLAQRRNAYPGFAGYRFRLKNNPSVTAECTWQFDNSGSSTPTDTTTTTTTTTQPTTPTTGGGGNTGGGGGSTPRDFRPSFDNASMPDQSYTEGTAITPLVLPEATGGNGRLFYALSPVLPEGLTLNRRVRRLSGTPTTPHTARQYTWTATDADGDAARITFTVTVVPDLRPSFDNASVPDQFYTEGTAITPFVLPEATGGNGPLTYALSPALPNGLTLNDVTRRLSGNPISPQDTTLYTWTATDADGDEAKLTFTIAIAVDPHRERIRVLARRVLAEMARRAMSGALDTIGARFGAVGSSGLSLAGQPVSLESVASVADGVGMAVWNNQSLALGELLGESAFSLRLAASGEAGDGVNSEGPLWSVWGRGDLASFAGGREEETHYDGWLRSGWLGIDARAGRWVGGMAVSHEQGQANYGATTVAASDRPVQGRLETSLTALYPYGRWRLNDGMELQGVVGVGWGEAHHTPADEQRETGPLSMRMASLGVRKSLPDVAGLALALRADAAVTRIETGDGPEVIHNLSADSWRLRTGLEASRRFALEGEAFLEPFLEAAARQDGGDGLEGSGVELAGGLRYSAPNVAVELRGRWLAAHSEEGAEEQGVSLTARYGPGADSQGLFFALSPRWGAATGGAQALWGEDLPVLSTASSGNSGAVDAQVGYGFALPQGGVLTPFAEVGMAGADSRRLRLGTRYAAAVTGLEMEVELAGERRESGDAAAEHALQLDVDLRF